MKKKIDKFENTTELLKAMAHPVRLKILKNLIDNGPTKVGSMQEIFQIQQPVVSAHLGKLRRAGILVTNRRGTEIYYKVESEFILRLANVLFD
ncbi:MULTISPECIES: ArsR/SmtB family transcription factor [Peptoniphilus]|uniref:ArsR/SmtB family transcription factor n=1 Tax=Peptoniphilus TaxID=162289 RepID=UPI0007917117|nr:MULTISPECIES: metalloregulator ArsR/SmtB family transcription factor [Peptoniphilus]KXB69904.1 putative transcriptional repressor PagR [Peptoniphilus sp. DNF00840]